MKIVEERENKMKGIFAAIWAFSRKYRSLGMFLVIVFLTAGFGFDCPSQLPSTQDLLDARFYDNGAVRSGSQRGEVRAIAVDTRTGNIFAGGVFIRMDGTPAYSIAVYDVTLDRWQELAGLGLTTNGTGEARVSALAISGKYLYVGGFFRGTASGVPNLNNIARYDIDAGVWSPLTDDGLSGDVFSLAVVGDDLYVGGNFNSTSGGGTVNLNNIARYNTATNVWSAFVNNGVNNFVSDFAVFGNDLFVSGGFNQTFDNAIGLNYIARYNLTTNAWSPLGSEGMNNVVYALAISGGSLYAGGLFTATGDFSMPLNRIAHYDIVAATWSPLANITLNGRVNALEFSGGTLYVGGGFEVSSSLRNIARYDTATETWSGLGDNGLIGGAVYAFAVSDNQLFVGGSFSGPYGAAQGYNHPGFARYSLADGGGFSEANGLPANSWLPVGLHNGKALNGEVSAVAVDANGIIYVGGNFTATDDGSVTNLNRIARYDPATNTWSALANNGLNGFAGVSALVIQKGNLYVGGGFTATFDGAVTNLNRVARYNLTTNSWSPLADNGVNGFGVYSLAMHGDNLYAGGDFTQTSNGTVTNLNSVARYNTLTNTWSPLAGNGLNSFVLGLAVQGDNLYVGGDFTQTANGATTNLNYISRYDTTNDTWSPLANNGLNDRVLKLQTFDNFLYVRGSFSETFDNAVIFSNQLARYDTAGNSWTAISGSAESVEVAQNLSAAVRNGNDLIIGGEFTILNNRVAQFFTRIYLQQWNVPSGSADWFDGSNWTTETVPAPNTNAVIPAGAGNINIDSADVTLGDLNFNGGTLTIGAGRTLTINGILSLNGGTITGNGTLVIASCQPDGIMGGNETSYIQTALIQCVNDSGTFNFPVGTMNGYSPVTVKGITGTGNISIKANQGAYSNPASGLPANRLARWWQIENPGGGITNANLHFNYLESDLAGDETSYRAYRIAGGTASFMTGTVNTFSNIVTASEVNEFSDWTLAELAPSSAEVSVSGQVLSAKGNGISKIYVSLTDRNGNTRTLMTNSFGYYSFSSVAAGETYIISVQSNRYQFAQPTRVLSVNDEITDLDFTALP